MDGQSFCLFWKDSSAQFFRKIMNIKGQACYFDRPMHLTDAF